MSAATWRGTETPESDGPLLSARIPPEARSPRGDGAAHENAEALKPQHAHKSHAMGLFGKKMECASPHSAGLHKLSSFEQWTRESIETGAQLVNMAVAILLLKICLIAVINTTIFTYNRIYGTSCPGWFMLAGKGQPPKLIAIRMNVGSSIMLALTILIATDVIDTLIKPSHEFEMEDLYKLCLIAGLRTFLSYFLGKEMEEAKEMLEHQIHHPEAKLIF